MLRRKWIAACVCSLLGMTPSLWGQPAPVARPGAPVVIDEARPSRTVEPALPPTVERTRVERSASTYTMVADPKVERPKEIQEGFPSSGPASGPSSEGTASTGGACGECKERCDGWGPTLPQDVKTFGPLWTGCDGRTVDIYGWLNAGYTYSSTGSGILNVAPRMNRFGNELNLHQAAIVLEKKLEQKQEFHTGFNAILYAGSDPALIQPRGGFTTTDPRWGVDFRHLYFSAHLPIITEGGLDVKVGRMSTVIGYESALAPYRPFYSNDYQWFYAQDGAFTGILGTLHVNKQLDLIAAITMGANTFFTYRNHAPCYLGQINYWTTEQKRTLLSASTYIGDQALFAAGPQFIGEYDYMFEFRIQHEWNKCLTQIIQSDLLFASGVPVIGTSEFYSLYSIWSYHATQKTDVNFRAEWVRDVHGARTGVRADYGEATLGLDYHPTRTLRFRPEVRGDLASRPAFGPNGDRQGQFTFGVDVIYSY